MNRDLVFSQGYRPNRDHRAVVQGYGDHRAVVQGYGDHRAGRAYDPARAGFGQQFYDTYPTQTTQTSESSDFAQCFLVTMCRRLCLDRRERREDPRRSRAGVPNPYLVQYAGPMAYGVPVVHEYPPRTFRPDQVQVPPQGFRPDQVQVPPQGFGPYGVPVVHEYPPRTFRPDQVPVAYLPQGFGPYQTTRPPTGPTMLPPTGFGTYEMAQHPDVPDPYAYRLPAPTSHEMLRTGQAGGSRRRAPRPHPERRSRYPYAYRLPAPPPYEMPRTGQAGGSGWQAPGPHPDTTLHSEEQSSSRSGSDLDFQPSFSLQERVSRYPPDSTMARYLRDIGQADTDFENHWAGIGRRMTEQERARIEAHWADIERGRIEAHSDEPEAPEVPERQYTFEVVELGNAPEAPERQGRYLRPGTPYQETQRLPSDARRSHRRPLTQEDRARINAWNAEHPEYSSSDGN